MPLLIMPLHRSLNRSNFPWLTLLLVLANVFVFAFLQSGDEAVFRQAQVYYDQSRLADIEFPAYLKWLQDHGKDAAKIEKLRSAPDEARGGLIESDHDFLAALHADKVIAPGNPDYEDWHSKRIELDRILDSTFTNSHGIRWSHFEPPRLVWAMFLHGGFEHIFWNMVFLVILGMLVEGSLGPLWFLVLYFLGGIGASLATLAAHWGVEGESIGASGAIAALTGAYCVIWGTRKVRVFYWFFVVFDYVRAPALLLLPFWFAGLVVLPWIEGGRTDFADHFGGLLSGAILGLGMRQLGLVRNSFIDEDERFETHERNSASFNDALLHLGKLEIPKARELLERIDREEPGQLRVIIALYRCARYRGTPSQLDATVLRVLGFANLSDPDLREVKSVYDDYVKACAGAPRLPPETLIGLLPTWQRLGDDAAVESLLRDLSVRAPDFPGLPAAWFSLAVRTPESSPNRRARLAHVVLQYAQSEFATKAQFLLSQN